MFFQTLSNQNYLASNVHPSKTKILFNLSNCEVSFKVSIH